MGIWMSNDYCILHSTTDKLVLQRMLDMTESASRCTILFEGKRPR